MRAVAASFIPAHGNLPEKMCQKGEPNLFSLFSEFFDVILFLFDFSQLVLVDLLLDILVRRGVAVVSQTDKLDVCSETKRGCLGREGVRCQPLNGETGFCFRRWQIVPEAGGRGRPGPS